MLESQGAAGARAGLQLDSVVHLVYSPSKTRYHILVKCSLRRHVQIIRVDPTSGALKFTFTYGKDMFPAEAQAMEFLKHDGPLEVVATGKHVLGYVVIGPTGHLLLAESVRVSATLPGNHQVKAVTTSRWHKVALQLLPGAVNSIGQPPPEPDLMSMSPAAREEYMRGVEKITTFQVDGAHFFCETLDITRPFPSDRPSTQPSWEFVWNRWLTMSFRGIGLDFVCPHLLQGLCEGRQLQDFDGAPYHLALISRRGRLHVGPRYKARGLNDYAEPANEIEVEQVLWRRPGSKDAQSPTAWSRYVWRRGSVPLWWGVHLRNGIGEAEIKIKERNTFKGSRRFVRRLQKRYTPAHHLDPETLSEGGAASTTATSLLSGTTGTLEAAAAGGSGAGAAAQAPGRTVAADPSLSVPVLFVSLLRKGTPNQDRSEAKLASAFDYMANALRKEHNLPLDYVAIDWHEMDKQLGSCGIVEAYWQAIKGLLPKHGFALGEMRKTDQDHYDLARAGVEPPQTSAAASALPRQVSWAGLGWQCKWFRQQRGVARYNCADSLDRTNVGSFYGATQVFVEQCRELDIAIAISPKGAANIAALMKRHTAGLAGRDPGLPTGSVTGSMASMAKLTAGARRPAAGPSGSGTGQVAAAPGLGNTWVLARESLGGGSSMAGTAPALNPGAAGAASAAKVAKEFNTLLAGLKSPRPAQQAVGPNDCPAAREAAAGSLCEHPLAPSPRDSPGAGPSALHAPASSMTRQAAGLSSLAQSAAPPPGLQPSQLSLLGQPGPVGDPDLPPGWEAKFEVRTQRMFYVDHNTKTTQWEHPTALHSAAPAIPAEPEEQVATAAGGIPPGPLPSSAAVPLPSGNQAMAAAERTGMGMVRPASPVYAHPSLTTLVTAPGGLQPAPAPAPIPLNRQSRQQHAASFTDLVSHGEREKARMVEDERELCEPLSPWCMFGASVKGFARRIHPEALFALAELFLVNGDMSAFLYTGSQAMHSERILLFEPENSKLRKAGNGVYGSMLVGIRRRYNNVLLDTDRQQQIELFLGMKHAVYFPNVKLYYKEEGNVPLDFPESDDDLDPISSVDWIVSAMDKSMHLVNSPGGPGSTVPAMPGGDAAPTPVVSHSRARNKSYTTQELFDATGRMHFTVTGTGNGVPAPTQPAALVAVGSPAGPAATLHAPGGGLDLGTMVHASSADTLLNSPAHPARLHSAQDLAAGTATHSDSQLPTLGDGTRQEGERDDPMLLLLGAAGRDSEVSSQASFLHLGSNLTQGPSHANSCLGMSRCASVDDLLGSPSHFTASQRQQQPPQQQPQYLPQPWAQGPEGQSRHVRHPSAASYVSLGTASPASGGSGSGTPEAAAQGSFSRGLAASSLNPSAVWERGKAHVASLAVPSMSNTLNVFKGLKGKLPEPLRQA
ncbi:SacI homology domain-containing protein [Haematococcus lacustris]